MLATLTLTPDYATPIGPRPDAKDTFASYRRERYRTDVGYAVGLMGRNDGRVRQWLSALGSHWETIPLFATEADAWDWHADRWGADLVVVGDELVCRRVIRRGRSYFEVTSA